MGYNLVLDGFIGVIYKQFANLLLTSRDIQIHSDKLWPDSRPTFWWFEKGEALDFLVMFCD